MTARDYTAGEYVRLLGTQSDHRMLPAQRRARLHGAIAELAGGGVRLEYRARLFLARAA